MINYLAANDESRERLAALIARLKDEDLRRPLTDGWTVSAVLAHLAFWDQRAVTLLRRWRREGFGPSPIDPDAVNDALLPLLLAISPRRAAELALDSARAIDAEVAELPPSLMAEIEEKATHFRLSRAHHRNEHLGELEALLGGKG